jgi:hypothetical protein
MVAKKVNRKLRQSILVAFFRGGGGIGHWLSTVFQEKVLARLTLFPSQFLITRNMMRRSATPMDTIPSAEVDASNRLHLGARQNTDRRVSGIEQVADHLNGTTEVRETSQT